MKVIIDNKKINVSNEIEALGVLKGIFLEVPELYSLAELREWIKSIGYNKIIKIKL